jgi:hypothetical protein
MRIVALSDTHNKHDQIIVPAGDVFVHAGNITRDGSLIELNEFNQWLGRLPHKHRLTNYRRQSRSLLTATKRAGNHCIK